MTPGVWAVVTTFEPDASLPAAIASIDDQVDGLIVVDDGSRGHASHEVLTQLERAGVRVLRGERNAGIAAALNRGIRIALDAGARAVVTFDQDSHAPAGFVASLLSARDGAAAEGLLVGPVVPQHFASVSQVRGRTAGGTLLARHVIQSGMMLDAETIRDVGGMLEPLFIDLVDTEYELRCLDHGRLAIAAPGASLEHTLGRRYRGRGALPLPVLTLSTPFRYFYRARNRVIIDRRYLRRRPTRILRDSALDAAHFLLACSLARPRRAMWRLLREGRRAGRRGQGGRIPDELRALASTVSWAADPVD
jgi:rhamnosyltransferase